ncbi:MAG: hypothetical protein K6F28_01100 [Lachnospiraceae bacterium]|nr:hypothetical protein [Lachnospiraceae bacterium]
MNESEKILSENSINDKELGEVNGGLHIGSTATVCPNCGSKNIYYTGETKKTFFGLLTLYKWHCGACGHDTWLSTSKKQ